MLAWHMSWNLCRQALGHQTSTWCARTIYLCNAPKSVGDKYTNICTCKEMRQKKQSNQNGKIINLEILKWRLEAKTNNHGLRVFSCEILSGGVVLMGARLQTLQSFEQKKPYKLWRRNSSFHGSLSFWKRKFNQTLITTQSLHHQTHTHPTTPPSSPSPPLKPHHRSPRKNLQFNTDPHPTTFQPHPPTPSNTTRSRFPTNNLLKQDLQYDADPHPATFQSHPPAPSNTTHHIFQPTTFQPNFAQLPACVWIETTTRTTWYHKLCSKVLGNQTQQHFTNKPSTTVFSNTTFLISLLPLWRVCRCRPTKFLDQTPQLLKLLVLYC